MGGAEEKIESTAVIAVASMFQNRGLLSLRAIAQATTTFQRPTNAEISLRSVKARTALAVERGCQEPARGRGESSSPVKTVS